MPVFPASFNPPISSVGGGGGRGLSPCRPFVPVPRCGVAVTVAAAEAARRSHGERRPCSDDVTTSVSDRLQGEPLIAPRSRSVGALVPHDPPRRTLSPTPFQARLSLSILVADLQTSLQELQWEHPCLRSLMNQLTAIVELLKVINCSAVEQALHLRKKVYFARNSKTEKRKQTKAS